MVRSVSDSLCMYMTTFSSSKTRPKLTLNMLFFKILKRFLNILINYKNICKIQIFPENGNVVNSSDLPILACSSLNYNSNMGLLFYFAHLLNVYLEQSVKTETLIFYRSNLGFTDIPTFTVTLNLLYFA